jgi:outer membrane biosynthesis protein TonB
VAHERPSGVIYSAVLHLAFFLLAFFGLPDFFKRDQIIEPAAITVEILPITGITNVKPSEEPPAPEEKKEEKPEAEQEKPSPPVKQAEATPEPKEPEVVKPEKKPEEKKPEPKKEEKKDDKKKKEESLDAVLKAVKDTAQKKKDDKTKKEKDTASSKSKSFSNRFDPSMQLSMSERDAIMSQIAKCWSVPAGAKDAQNLIVVVMVDMNPDGSYAKVELADDSKSRYSRDSFFRAAADSAIRAVKMCSPLKGLPADRYNGWSQLELHFDPKYMLN